MTLPAHLLLLPGWMMPGSVFDPVLARLKRPAPESGACTTLDWTLALDPAGLAATVRHVPGTCWLVGWSLGAQAALRLALDPPPNLQRLVLLGATARLATAPGYEGVAGCRLRAMRRRLIHDPEGLLIDFFRLCHAPHAAADPVSGPWLEQALHVPRDRADAGLSLLAETDLRTDLDRVRIPTTLLHGEADAVVPIAQARYLAERLAEGLLRVVPRTGHWPSAPLWESLLEALRSPGAPPALRP